MINKAGKVLLAALCISAIVFGLIAIHLDAIGPTNEPNPPKDKWEEVCCGSGCPHGVDYCTGSGDKTCCKT